jgi:hypothetical protein
MARGRAPALAELAAVLVLFGLASFSPAIRSPGWRSLAPGMDLKVVAAASAEGSRLTVVRIDPGLWALEFAGISLTGDSLGKNARQWCESRGLTAAINAGMFATDYRTHVGYLRFREHVNSGRVNHYLSVAAFDPQGGSGRPRFRIFDLDSPGVSMTSILKDYASVIQNLRLVKRPGENRWPRQDKKWSAAVLGEDEAGNILFIFCRAPFSMHDLNHELLEAGIGLVASQHLEGGPEAQLYLHAGDVELDLFGSYETSFHESDGNARSWPIPNVIGVRPRKPGTEQGQGS